MVLEKQRSRQATYKIENHVVNNNVVNGRRHWKSVDGNQAIWFDFIANVWIIGSSSDLGSSNAGIHSAHDSACPTQNGMRFKYSSSGFHVAPMNSVSLTCI